MNLLSNVRMMIGLAVCVLIVGRLEAQSRFVGTDVRCGHVLCNNAESRTYINSSTYGFSFYVGNNYFGNDYWHSYWKNPSFGLELSYDYIDNSVTGNKLGALFFIRPSVYKSQSLSVDAYLGLGLSYFSKTYHKTANPHNTYIGSHFNALINLGVLASYFVSEHFAFTAAAKFSHSSNGQMFRPNFGLNFCQLELGAEYYLDGYNHDVMPMAKPEHKVNAVNISFSPGITESKQTMKHYFASSISIAYSRRFHPCFAYGVGYDFMYNGTIASTPWYTDSGLSDCFSQGVVANFECLWGRVALRVGLGAYLINGRHQRMPFYERAGLFYYIGQSQSQYIGISIKAHAANADFIEWTYGIAFR